MNKANTPIYLDNAATTKIDPEVAKLIFETSSAFFGNPSSIHRVGRQAKTVIEKARRTIAQIINASIGEIFFTSGGTESNNMVLSAMPQLGLQKLITTKGEHPSIANYVKSQNIAVEYVNIDNLGRVDYEHLENLLKKQEVKCLVSIIHGHNEIGTINDLQIIGDICKKHDALFHTDTVQTIGHRKIDVQKENISFLSSSGHKYHGPRGVGFVFINNNSIIDPYFFGGAQERNMRAGTEDTASIAGISRALQIQHDNLEIKESYLQEIKTYFINQIKDHFPEVTFNGDIEFDHLPHVLNVSFPLTSKSDLMVMSLDLEGICVSGGSACSSGVEQASPILEAIKMPHNRKAIRFSFSKDTTKEEVDICINKIQKIIS